MFKIDHLSSDCPEEAHGLDLPVPGSEKGPMNVCMIKVEESPVKGLGGILRLFRPERINKSRSIEGYGKRVLVRFSVIAPVHFLPSGVKSDAMRLGRYAKRSPVVDGAAFVLVIAVLTWITGTGTARLGYNWQWYRVPQYLWTYEDGRWLAGPLIDGLTVTFEITGASLVLAFCFGLTSALCRLSDSYLARVTARAYLELIRNTPLLVQLFFIYFVMAPIFDLSRFSSAVLALSLFEGAYASEIFRAGIVSIHKGQWEAACSLGLSTFDTYRRIILPQAIRRILPPLTSQAISLVKDSALVSTIAVYDLTMRGREIISETFLAFEIWFTIAGIYLLVTVSLSIVVSRMERRLSGSG